MANGKAARGNRGRTPLHREASDGFLRGVKELLESGADVNARDESGRTPLHWPAYRGHLEVVRLLCEHGADVNAADNDGRTPLRLATSTTARGHRLPGGTRRGDVELFRDTIPTGVYSLANTDADSASVSA